VPNVNPAIAWTPTFKIFVTCINLPTTSNGRIYVSVFIWWSINNLFTTCNFSRNCKHQNRWKQRRCAWEYTTLLLNRSSSAIYAFDRFRQRRVLFFLSRVKFAFSLKHAIAAFKSSETIAIADQSPLWTSIVSTATHQKRRMFGDSLIPFELPWKFLLQK
jgi:hypothetical protein